MMGGLFTDSAPMNMPAPSPHQQDHSLDIKRLSEELQRLKLLNQALWELLRERAHLTDKDLEEKAIEIDLRDGKQDGRMTETAIRCPTCKRVSSNRHWRCLYCGQEFEKPVMG